MTPDQSFTLAVTAVGTGGAIAGIVIGHILTRSSQHRQWLRDNRKQEFKEIVTVMSQFVIEHMSFVSSQGTKLPQSMQNYLDSMKAVSCVLCDRVYIHADLEERKIPERFLEIMEHFRTNVDDFDSPADKATELLREIIAIAQKE